MDKVDDIVIILGKESDSNTYIIGDTIIDPGSGYNMDYLLDEIKQAGISMDDISKIVNTHCHYDHMGADKYLQDEYSYDIYLHPIDAEAVINKDAKTTVATSFNAEIPDLDIKTINEGDKVGNYEVIHTPGHTKGSICLVNDKSIVSGDTLFSGGNFGRIDLPTGDRMDMKRSIQRIADLDIVQIFPGHGPYAISAVSEQISLALMIATRL